ncbi:MAG: zinc ribbon domain-containing protein [Planctomycetota bacterium]|nr:zinc ribbon domain-containing protein [Planctomycetota bacterium]
MARFCAQCGNELAMEAKFCGRCGAAAPSAASSGVGEQSAAERGSKSSSRVLKGCLIAFGVFWLIGVGAQVGWMLWKERKQAAAEQAFFTVARPLLGQWKVTSDPSLAKLDYQAVLKPNSSAGIPGEAPEVLYIECADDAAAPAWLFRKCEDGRLVGGGMDQRSEGSDFSLATGTAEVSADGKRLTLRMKWDGGEERVTVLERAESAKPVGQ